MRRVGWWIALWLLPVAAAACTPSVEDCSAAGDEDGNGQADCGDPQCWVEGNRCAEVCDSAFDEDADGMAGCLDEDCWVLGGGCDEACASGTDEDGDGAVDCDDDDCWMPGGVCAERCESDGDEDGDGAGDCLDDECWVEDGPCEEVCTGLDDEDGDGDIDCDDADCLDAVACVPSYANDVQPIFARYCANAGCHVGDLPAGLMSVNRYRDMLEDSYYCAGLVKGECTIERLLNGTMPANGTSLPQRDIDIVQRWVDGGVRP